MVFILASHLLSLSFRIIEDRLRNKLCTKTTISSFKNIVSSGWYPEATIKPRLTHNPLPNSVFINDLFITTGRCKKTIMASETTISPLSLNLNADSLVIAPAASRTNTHRDAQT